MLLRSNQSGVEDVLPRPNPGSMHAHYYSEEPTTWKLAQKDGNDERGKHRHEWEDHRPMEVPPFGRDNNRLSYARVRRIGGRRWEKIVTDIAPIVVA